MSRSPGMWKILSSLKTSMRRVFKLSSSHLTPEEAGLPANILAIDIKMLFH